MKSEGDGRHKGLVGFPELSICGILFTEGKHLLDSYFLGEEAFRTVSYQKYQETLS